MRRVVLALVTALSLGLAAVPPARADDASDSLLSASAEAYAMRVEYDLPAPAGSGTVAHVNATAQRSSSVESSHGLAAAPSELDAVVGGKYGDPQGTGHPVNKAPQVECNYPSDDPTHVFRFPTDTNDSYAGVPATSYSYASCGSGPSVELRAHIGDPGAAAASDPSQAASPATTESSGAEIRPDKGVLRAQASSTAQGISLAGGAITIGSVTATGASATAGSAGTGSSEADVLISDIAVAGTTFSLGFTGSAADESVSMTIAGQTVPIADGAARTVVDGANQALSAIGCTMTVVSDPAKYPQGFLFARPQPDIGVADDGSLAASYRGGLLVVCNVPDNPVSQATKFYPERFQALIGFVYTSVAAKAEIGGFGIGDTGGTAGGPTLTGAVIPTEATLGLGSSQTPVALPGTTATVGASAAGTAGADQPASFITSVLKPLPPGARWALLLSCLALWGWLTHLALTRLVGIGARDEELPA